MLPRLNIAFSFMNSAKTGPWFAASFRFFSAWNAFRGILGWLHDDEARRFLSQS